MNRRAFMLALAAGTVAATAGTAAATSGDARRGAAAPDGALVRPPVPGGSAAARRSNLLQQPAVAHRPAQSLTSAAGGQVSEAGTATVIGQIVPAVDSPPTGSSDPTAPVDLGPAEPTPTPQAPVAPTVAPLPINLATVPHLINGLPGAAQTVALTIDDGTSSAVVGAYLDFAEASGVRLTFFLNGVNRSWTDHKEQLRRLVDSGQVQLGNHTWSHPDITSLSDSALANEIRRNEKFLNDTYGVTGRPFLRPPYGYHNTRSDRVCAELGYSSITMWYGSFGDSSLLSEAQLMSLAQQWMTAHRVVIGHANHPTVTHLYPQLLDLIRQRGLTTVTLDDAFFGPAGRDRTNLS